MSVHTIEIEIKDIIVRFGYEEILSNLTLKLKGPSLVQIIGPNGAGKTTLFKAILGLIKPVSGRITVNGIDTTAKPDKVGNFVGYVPQLMPIDSHIPITAWEIVLNSLLLHRRRFPRILAKKDEIEKVKNTLNLVDLPQDRWHKPFFELSGGERQRVLLARALVYDPQILLLDEPLSAVDPLGKVELAEIIGELAKSKLILVTSHDPILLLPYTDQIILLNRSYYIIGKPEEILTVDVLKNVYGESAILLEEHVHISDEH